LGQELIVYLGSLILRVKSQSALLKWFPNVSRGGHYHQHNNASWRDDDYVFMPVIGTSAFWVPSTQKWNALFILIQFSFSAYVLRQLQKHNPKRAALLLWFGAA
jgi:hypothetical protein